MNKNFKIFILIFSLFNGGVTFADNSNSKETFQNQKSEEIVKSIVSQIEQNNPSLKALRSQIDAEKIENKTGITMTDPEVEFNYLWGKPALIGNRKDFSVKQSFDFPTTYFIKGNIADKQNIAAELKYKASKIDLVLQAKQAIIDLSYYNSLYSILKSREDDAKTLADLYSKSFEKGEANIIEKNKAELNYVNIKALLANAEADREAVVSKLTTLNGGVDINLNSIDGGSEKEIGDLQLLDYNDNLLGNSFEEWYDGCVERNPMLEYVKQQIEISEKEVKLSKHERMPKLSAGYMSESVVGETFQGISVGVSIPLWENKNKTKLAKAKLIAQKDNEVNSKVEFYSQLKTLYSKTKSLSKIAADYKTSIVSLDNTILLRKALDAGKISLLEYIQEQNLYYDMVNSYLDSQKNYANSVAEMESF
ncbi:MAG: TolC family protein [Bacteroidales bacterium]|nr:TolC family protein [Bacteroidales bacterium]